MERKTLGKMLALGAIAYGTYELSKTAFSSETAKEVVNKSHGACVGQPGELCVWEHITGEAASYQKGYFIQAAHYPNKHKPYPDTDPDNGRALCTLCHAIEEVKRGNDWGARKLLESGVYTHKYEAEYGYQWRPKFSKLKHILTHQPARDLSQFIINNSHITQNTHI